MKFHAEMNVEFCVTFDMLEKCREIQKKDPKAFVVSDFANGRMSDGDLLSDGFKLTFDGEGIDSAMEFLTYLKSKVCLPG